MTADFDNRTMRQAETKACAFLDMDHKAIPVNNKFSLFFQLEISIHFVHFRFECKHRNFNNTIFMREKNVPENVIKSLY